MPGAVKGGMCRSLANPPETQAARRGRAGAALVAGGCRAGSARAVRWRRQTPSDRRKSARISHSHVPVRRQNPPFQAFGWVSGQLPQFPAARGAFHDIRRVLVAGFGSEKGRAGCLEANQK